MLGRIPQVTETNTANTFTGGRIMQRLLALVVLLTAASFAAAAPITVNGELSDGTIKGSSGIDSTGSGYLQVGPENESHWFPDHSDGGYRNGVAIWDVSAVPTNLQQAEVQFYLFGKQGSPSYNVDVYVLGLDSTTFPGYVGPDDATQTKIADDLFTPSSAVSTAYESTGDSADLVSLLNSRTTETYLYVRLSWDFDGTGLGLNQNDDLPGDVANTAYNVGSANSSKAPLLVYDVIPEPASLALLGLGGLAMLRRRRA